MHGDNSVFLLDQGTMAELSVAVVSWVGDTRCTFCCHGDHFVWLTGHNREDNWLQTGFGGRYMEQLVLFQD